MEDQPRPQRRRTRMLAICLLALGDFMGRRGRQLHRDERRDGPGLLVVPLIPAAVTVAILRYQLLDIRLVFSRTLAYAIVTGVLAGVYAGLVPLTTQAVPFSAPVAVATSTLACAAMFTPLRWRTQRIVDRRFNRARYDADRAIAGFTARLQDSVDLDAVSADLSATVQAALEPAHLSVWISHRPS